MLRTVLLVSTLVAPIVVATAIGSFAFSETTVAVANVRGLLVAVPLFAFVLGVVSQRRAHLWVFAYFGNLLSLGLAVYAAAAWSGAHSAASLLDRPSALIAILAAAWASAASATALHASAAPLA